VYKNLMIFIYKSQSRDTKYGRDHIILPKNNKSLIYIFFVDPRFCIQIHDLNKIGTLNHGPPLLYSNYKLLIPIHLRQLADGGPIPYLLIHYPHYLRHLIRFFYFRKITIGQFNTFFSIINIHDRGTTCNCDSYH